MHGAELSIIFKFRPEVQISIQWIFVSVITFPSLLLLVLCATCAFSATTGILVTFPSVLNPAILSPNSTDIRATPDQASWIAASHGLSGILGYVILAPIFQVMGRKIVNITANVIVLIGWIIFYFSSSVTSLICARLVQGLAVGGIFIIIITLSESSHRSRRGYFMSLKKVSFALGSLTCHSLAFIWTWRQIALFTIILQVVSGFLACLCPESPSYLAMTGQFKECKKVYRWLFGESTETEKELKDLISAQMKNIDKKMKLKRSTCQKIKETFKILSKKDFQRPFFIVVLATLAIDACGRYFMMAYITQIMIEITGDKAVSMYCSVAADCLLIIAFSISCFMVKKFSRRTLMFSLGFLSAFLMFLVSATVILSSYSLNLYIGWLTPSTVLLHSFVTHLGLVPVTFVIIGEIFPLEYKGLGSFTTGILFTLFYSLTLKFTPLLITSTGVEGTYAIYGLCVALCLGILYFILPETKNRTLQDIENEIRGVKINETDVQSVLLNGRSV